MYMNITPKAMEYNESKFDKHPLGEWKELWKLFKNTFQANKDNLI